MIALWGSPARSTRGHRATLDHYEEVPAHLAEKVIEQHRKESGDIPARGLR